MNGIMEFWASNRTNAIGHPRYISFETLRECDDPNEILVISMREKKLNWNADEEVSSRNEIETEFAKILHTKTAMK